MNTLTWKPVTHNNPYTIKEGEGLIFMPQANRAVISLPLNINPGTLVGIIDAGGTFDIQPLTIDPNGYRINNSATDSYVLNTANSAVQLLYTGTVYGWKILANPQTDPLAGAVNFAISAFIEDTFSLTNDYLIWLLNPPNNTKYINLPSLSGNKGLYYMLVNVSTAYINIRPYSDDKIMGLATDYTLAGQSAIHIAASGETSILGWVLTAKNTV